MSQKLVLRFGAIVIAGAILLRLTIGVWTPAIEANQKITANQVILFLQTGRVLYEQPALAYTVPQPEAEPTPLTSKPIFSESDQALVQLQNTSNKSANVSAALQQTLQWDLCTQQPTVLIIHSHGSESYQNTEAYTESSSFRTQDTDYNMISIGEQLAQELENAGICVIHDRTMYDVPSYNDAYVQARTAIEQHLAENPSICMVLDLHRDAAEDNNGSQIGYTVETPEGTAAQLMLVLGTNHENWQNNLSLATKLHVQLEKQVSGICRPINVRAQRYNQDLCAGAVLVEVGAAGNTRQEALLATKYLSQAVISLAAGTS